VQFLARLRDERRFPSVDALRAQIALDVASARRVLGAAPG
jgi:riboflavin kinase/FMN adenylyltransferase